MYWYFGHFIFKHRLLSAQRSYLSLLRFSGLCPLPSAHALDLSLPQEPRKCCPGVRSSSSVRPRASVQKPNLPFISPSSFLAAPKPLLFLIIPKGNNSEYWNWNSKGGLKSTAVNSSPRWRGLLLIGWVMWSRIAWPWLPSLFRVAVLDVRSVTAPWLLGVTACWMPPVGVHGS